MATTFSITRTIVVEMHVNIGGATEDDRAYSLTAKGKEWVQEERRKNREMGCPCCVPRGLTAEEDDRLQVLIPFDWEEPPREEPRLRSWLQKSSPTAPQS